MWKERTLDGAENNHNAPAGRPLDTGVGYSNMIALAKQKLLSCISYEEPSLPDPMSSASGHALWRGTNKQVLRMQYTDALLDRKPHLE